MTVGGMREEQAKPGGNERGHLMEHGGHVSAGKAPVPWRGLARPGRRRWPHHSPR